MNRLITLCQRIEDAILVTLLLTMITMAVLQILLRNLFDTGIVWADPMVRVLVLWLGLIGAMVASRSGNHISIDVISRYLPKLLKQLSRLAVNLFTAAISGLMAWHGFRFVAMERTDQITAFANVPAWVCEAIIPVAFAVISIRYLLFFFQGILKPFRS